MMIIGQKPVPGSGRLFMFDDLMKILVNNIRVIFQNKP